MAWHRLWDNFQIGGRHYANCVLSAPHFGLRNISLQILWCPAFQQHLSPRISPGCVKFCENINRQNITSHCFF